MVQLRAYIERIRPIDKQLAYQIEKLLRTTDAIGADAATADAAADAATADGADGDEGVARGRRAAAAAAAGDDPLSFRPNPRNLMTKVPLGGLAGNGFIDGGEGAGGVGGEPAPVGIYRPPKLNPVAMEEDREASRQERRAMMDARRRAKGRWAAAARSGRLPHRVSSVLRGSSVDLK
jgi:U3 small nucleolar RNA-associated protein 3